MGTGFEFSWDLGIDTGDLNTGLLHAQSVLYYHGNGQYVQALATLAHVTRAQIMGIYAMVLKVRTLTACPAFVRFHVSALVEWKIGLRTDEQ